MHEGITKLKPTRKNNQYIQKILKTKCELRPQIFLLGIIPENIDAKYQLQGQIWPKVGK